MRDGRQGTLLPRSHGQSGIRGGLGQLGLHDRGVRCYGRFVRTGITKRLSTFCRQYYPLVATRLSQASKNLQGRQLYAWVADLNRMSPSINPCTRLIRCRAFLSALVSNVSDQTMRSLPRALTAAVIGRCSSGVHHSRYIRAQPKSNRSWRILATPI